MINIPEGKDGLPVGLDNGAQHVHGQHRGGALPDGEDLRIAVEVGNARVLHDRLPADCLQTLRDGPDGHLCIVQLPQRVQQAKKQALLLAGRVILNQPQEADVLEQGEGKKLGKRIKKIKVILTSKAKVKAAFDT